MSVPEILFRYINEKNNSLLIKRHITYYYLLTSYIHTAYGSFKLKRNLDNSNVLTLKVYHTRTRWSSTAICEEEMTGEEDTEEMTKTSEHF